jgi:hypothetical protein
VDALCAKVNAGSESIAKSQKTGSGQESDKKLKKKNASASKRTSSRRLSSQEKSKVRELLQAKDAAAIDMGFAMLKSLQVTVEEWVEVFCKRLICHLVDSWDVDVWNVVGAGLQSHKSLWNEFSSLAVERFAKLSEPKRISWIKTALSNMSPHLSALIGQCLCKPEGAVYDMVNDILSGFTSLSDAAAESLSKHEGDIYLNALTNLSDAAAKSLSQCKGNLYIEGLTSLSDAAAKSLSKHKGNDLILFSLTSLSDTPGHVALALHFGKLARTRNVYLASLANLSDAAADSLSKYKSSKQGVKRIELGDLKSLSDAAAESLSKFESLDIGLTSLSDTAAESLSNVEDLSIRGLTSLSVAAAEGLSKQKGWLVLDGLTSISDAAAASLSKHKGTGLILDVTSLSDAAAKSLSNYEGGRLSLDGLTSLSDAVAERLSHYKQELTLKGLTGLLDTPGHILLAKKLSKQEGGNLNLNKLTSLSDAAADSLSQFKGTIELFGLKSMSDPAAASLSKLNSVLCSSEIGKKITAARQRLRKRR